MDREKLRRKCKYGFAAFLVAMAGLTVLSRVLYSITVPKVEVGYCKNGPVTYEITGNGTFSPTGLTYIAPYSGLKVQRVEVVSGQRVTAGDVLFSYQMDSVTDKQKELGRALEKIDLDLEQLKLKEGEVPGLTAEELALQSVETAKRALEFGYQDLEQVRTESQEKLDQLSRDFNYNMNQSEEEMEEETRRQYKSAERAYDVAVTARDSAIKRAEREVSDCEEEYERLEEDGASEKELLTAERALERAREDLELVKEEQQLNVDNARAAVDAAEDDYGDVSAGRRTAAEALRSSYEASVEAVNERIKSEEKNVRGLLEVLRQAEQSAANARIQDAGTQAEKQITAASNNIEIRKLQLERQAAEEALFEVNQLAGRQGEVTAETEAIVAEMELTPGKMVDGSEIVALGDGGLLFHGLVDKKMAQLLGSGSALTLQYGDTMKPGKAVIEEVNFLKTENPARGSSAGGDAEEAEFTARTEEAIGAPGATATFSINLQSQQYDKIIPIEGLRQEERGYYILVVRPEKTILGEEQTAVKIPVEVLEKSSGQAAVTGAFGNTDQIITGSSKVIGENDRVRISGE